MKAFATILVAAATVLTINTAAHANSVTPAAAGKTFGNNISKHAEETLNLRVKKNTESISVGTRSPAVKTLHRKLRFLTPYQKIFGHEATHKTLRAVNHLRFKYGLPPVEKVGAKTAALINSKYGKGKVPQRCLQKQKIVCVSTHQKVGKLFVRGEPVLTFDTRFGTSATPTRKGLHYVYSKQEYLISDLTGTPMPYSLFFDGGQALHYSEFFARDGYNGGSHGCVNIRSMDAAKTLYRKTPVGTPVYIY